MLSLESDCLQSQMKAAQPLLLHNASTFKWPAPFSFSSWQNVALPFDFSNYALAGAQRDLMNVSELDAPSLSRFLRGLLVLS